MSDLGESEQRFRAIFEQSPEAMLVADDEGSYIEANAAACALLGRSREELLTMSIRAVSAPHLDYDEAWETFRRVGRMTGGWQLVRPDGSIRDVEYSSLASVLPGVHMSVLRDVTQQKQVEAELARKTELLRLREQEREERAVQLEVLAEAAVAIGSSTSITRITETVTERARLLIGAHAAVTSIESDDGRMGVIRASSLSDEYIRSESDSIWPDGAGLPRQVRLSNGPIRLTRVELEAHPAWLAGGSIRPSSARGWLGVPLIGRDAKNLGLIQLSDKLQGEFSAQDSSILVQFAQMVSVAVENARLFHEASVAHERLEALSRRLVTTQESERREVARELHDEVGQLLTGLGLMIEAAQGTDPIRREEMRRVVNELIARVRDLSMNLRPPMLDELGLIPTLLWQLERFEAATKIEVDFRHAKLDRRLPSETEITVFRIVQEALTNVARHADAKKAQVELWVDREKLGVRVEDHGRGFLVETAYAGGSTGFTGMRERCRLLGGRLTVASEPGSGTRLVAELPLPERPLGAGA